MKINVAQVLTNFDGNDLTEARRDPETKAIEEIPATLRSILCQALVNVPESERDGTTGSKKVERFLLAQQIYKRDEVSLSAEDIVELKRLVELTFRHSVAAVAAVFLVLDPPAGVASA